jgi:hypothetical protein
LPFDTIVYREKPNIEYRTNREAGRLESWEARKSGA